MENKEVKVDSHENVPANQHLVPIKLKELSSQAHDVPNSAEQSENLTNIEVCDTKLSNNNLDQDNETLHINDKMYESHNLSNAAKDIEFTLTGTDQGLSRFSFAANSTVVNLSNYGLTEVPEALLTLKHVEKLDLSNNNIKRFDETPSFLHTVQEISLANNSLVAPPLWIWKEGPRALNSLDISNNKDIVSSLTNQEIYEFQNYRLTVKKINLIDCRIQYFRKILLTLVDVKEITIGAYDDNTTSTYANKISEFPCRDLKCYNVEHLNLSNIMMYQIHESINNYKSLTYLDLSYNNLSYMPEEFGDLELLETCKLSFNQLLYLPDKFQNLKKLKVLYLDNNRIYLLPENLLSLPELKCVDLYQNYLQNEYFEVHDKFDEIDFEQNFFNESENSMYIEKKTKLRNRLGVEWRIDGKREIDIETEQSSSDCESDNSVSDDLDIPVTPDAASENVESEEDWDSDSYWEPSFLNRYYVEKKTPWEDFMKKKISEGNFCPIDLHQPTILDKIMYNRQICPQPQNIPVEGQFDDLSDDDT